MYGYKRDPPERKEPPQGISQTEKDIQNDIHLGAEKHTLSDSSSWTVPSLPQIVFFSMIVLLGVGNRLGFNGWILAAFTIGVPILIWTIFCVFTNALGSDTFFNRMIVRSVFGGLVAILSITTFGSTSMAPVGFVVGYFLREVFWVGVPCIILGIVYLIFS